MEKLMDSSRVAQEQFYCSLVLLQPLLFFSLTFRLSRCLLIIGDRHIDPLQRERILCKIDSHACAYLLMPVSVCDGKTAFAQPVAWPLKAETYWLCQCLFYFLQHRYLKCGLKEYLVIFSMWIPLQWHPLQFMLFIRVKNP